MTLEEENCNFCNKKEDNLVSIKLDYPVTGDKVQRMCIFFACRECAQMIEISIEIMHERGIVTIE